MALAWSMRDSRMTSVLIGASRPEQISENAAAISKLEFTEEEYKLIEEILR